MKRRLQHSCFLVNIAKFLRTAFFKEHLRWLSLIVTSRPLLQMISHIMKKNETVLHESNIAWRNRDRWKSVIFNILIFYSMEILSMFIGKYHRRIKFPKRFVWRYMPNGILVPKRDSRSLK